MKHLVAAVTLALLVCSGAFAALTPCPTNTSLTFYATNFMTAATGCQIDDKVFFGFAPTLSAGGGGSTAGVGITVSPIATAFNPGLSFTLSGFSVGSNSSLDLKLGFIVQTISGAAIIEDASLGIAGAQFSGTGLVSIGENVCVGAPFSNVAAGTGCPAGDENLSLNVQNPGPPQVFFDMKFTKSFANTVGVFKDVSVNGGSAGSASLSSFTQQFSEIPEPGSIMLLGTSLLLSCIAARRKWAKQ